MRTAKMYLGDYLQDNVNVEHGVRTCRTILFYRESPNALRTIGSCLRIASILIDSPVHKSTNDVYALLIDFLKIDFSIRRQKDKPFHLERLPHSFCMYVHHPVSKAEFFKK